MTATAKRATVYMDADFHETLKLYAAEQEKTISCIMLEAVKNQLAEDVEDINDVIARKNEKGIPLEDFMERLKRDGKI